MVWNYGMKVPPFVFLAALAACLVASAPADETAAAVKAEVIVYGGTPSGVMAAVAHSAPALTNANASLGKSAFILF